VIALLYHDVSDGTAGGFPSLTVSPSQFERHLRWLRRLRVQTITPRQYSEVRAGRAKLSGRAVILTFDDAYAALTRMALPALKEFGLTAAIYVVSSEIEGINRWDLDRGSAPIPLMSAEEISYWSRQGFEFGAHSRTHRDMTGLSDQELEDELAGSKRALEQLTPYPVTSFAYPYGAVDDRVAAAAGRHFKTAFTTLEGTNTDATDTLRLRRTGISSRESNLEFLSRTIFGKNMFSVPRSIAGRAKRLVIGQR
jgi:peptidoglycan/xylan/chitin deacetylase (PgdA/CDA1 family)